MSTTQDQSNLGKRMAASPQKVQHRPKKSSTDGLHTAFLAPIGGSPRSNRSPNGPGPTLTPTSVYNTTTGDYFGETWQSRKANTKLGEPVTAMSIQYVTTGAQKPRRIDDVNEDRTSPLPPSKSASKSDLRSLDDASVATAIPAEPKRSRGHRSPTQKSMLSKALAKANSAVLLDNSSKIDGAIAAYAEACDLLQEVMVRSSDMDDRKKLSAIRKTYSYRIAELHDLDDPFANLIDKDLPDDPPSDEGNDSFFQSAGGPSTVEALEQVHIPPRQESLLPQIYGGEKYLDDSNVGRARQKPLPLPRASNLNVPMESKYMPPPLSPRRLNPPTPAETSSEPTPEEAIASHPRPLRRGSSESTSWLDTIDDGESLHSSSYKSRLSRLSAMGLQLTNNSLANEIEAEFDAALNAAVDAAYESEDALGTEDTPRVEQKSTLFGSRLPLQLSNQQKPAQTERPRADSDLESTDFLDEDTTEEEERLLDEMTQGFVLDDFGFDHKSKSALPRQSDSSTFSGRTLSSSNQSTTMTTATNLSTLAEAIEPTKPVPSKDTPLPPPPTVAESMSPPKAVGLSSPPHKPERLSAINLRDRRLSGQNALKIETYAPARGTAQSHPKAPPKIEIPIGPDVQKPLPPPGPPSTGTVPVTPLTSVHSNESQASESPATPALTQGGSRNSMDETSAAPSSPAKLSKMMPPPSTVMRKNVSSTSLRQKNLSVSGINDDPSPLTPSSAMGSASGMFGDRKNNVPPLPTPTTATFTHQASFSGGWHLFDDHIGTAASPRTPRSPDDAPQADPPVPLEPCPESFLLRPWWLMRCLYQVVAHPRGGYLTTNLFLPRDIWRVKNVKLRFLEDKISQCDILTAALLGLAKVDNYDADAMLIAMQSFENELERVRVVLQKKMGNEVGLSHSTNVFKSPTDETDPMSVKTPTSSSAAKSFASGWRKLRSKSSTPAMPNGGGGVSKDPALAAALTMPSLPMTSSNSVKTSSRGNGHRHKIAPPTPSQLTNIPVMHATYMSSLARLFDAAQILDAIARQVEDPGLKASNKTHVGLELSVRSAAEFFAFFMIRFVMADINILVDKFLKRGAEWVLA
ncbi:uncharacterized protein HMPREF1541_01579 [Cyphellophora europaea CBS 101466]|uniref:MIT domain-containing protein n=1 Tax=Cyphellophora europaea (strain CBS 101466) TaxID=1220924 RepID=W2S3B8_CYPE1|nr:uncharacterized protein HMPREF1541_01579 [Cyphellophora europaea CBS 101466]ETN42424.1 hypothetical protein HMPREF1541_01579 [Cyphellophora europaea CBS 101466]